MTRKTFAEYPNLRLSIHTPSKSATLRIDQPLASAFGFGQEGGRVRFDVVDHNIVKLSRTESGRYPTLRIPDKTPGPDHPDGAVQLSFALSHLGPMQSLLKKTEMRMVLCRCDVPGELFLMLKAPFIQEAPPLPRGVQEAVELLNRHQEHGFIGITRDDRGKLTAIALRLGEAV